MKPVALAPIRDIGGQVRKRPPSPATHAAPRPGNSLRSPSPERRKSASVPRTSPRRPTCACKRPMLARNSGETDGGAEKSQNSGVRPRLRSCEKRAPVHGDRRGRTGPLSIACSWLRTRRIPVSMLPTTHTTGGRSPFAGGDPYLGRSPLHVLCSVGSARVCVRACACARQQRPLT